MGLSLCVDMSYIPIYVLVAYGFDSVAIQYGIFCWFMSITPTGCVFQQSSTITSQFGSTLYIIALNVCMLILCLCVSACINYV